MRDDIGFDKTVVPVRLARAGGDSLVSRSQAKRVLARVDQFKIVMLDFKGVESIGQVFLPTRFFGFFRIRTRISNCTLSTRLPKSNP